MTVLQKLKQQMFLQWCAMCKIVLHWFFHLVSKKYGKCFFKMCGNPCNFLLRNLSDNDKCTTTRFLSFALVLISYWSHSQTIRDANHSSQRRSRDFSKITAPVTFLTSRSCAHGHRKGGQGPLGILNLKLFLIGFQKKFFFLSFECEKWNFVTFGSPWKIIFGYWKNPLLATPGKNPPDTHFCASTISRPYAFSQEKQ